MKIRPFGAEFFIRTDRQTDLTKLIAALCNFADAPKNCYRAVVCCWPPYERSRLYRATKVSHVKT